MNHFPESMNQVRLIKRNIAFCVFTVFFSSITFFSPNIIGQPTPENDAVIPSTHNDLKPHPEIVTLLSEYLKINSVTGNEKVAGEYLANLCREKGLHVNIFSELQNSYNFSASVYPLSLGKPNIVLMNHIDVVPAGDESEWNYDAFSGHIDDEFVWGRGAVDMKGMAIMQLLAISDYALTENDLPFNLTILAVSSEEQLGEFGAKLVVENHLRDLNPVLVLGEGGIGLKGLSTSKPDQLIFCLSVADKTALWLDVNLKISTNGHGAIPPREYTTKSMIHSLNKLVGSNPKIHFNETNKILFKGIGKIEGGIKGFVLRNIGFFKPLASASIRKQPAVYATTSNTITITELNTPAGSVNQIAQTISAKLDCRLLPETNKEQFIAEIMRKLKRKDIQVMVIEESIQAKPTKPEHFYDLFKEAIKQTHPGSEVVPILFPAVTDNNYFRREGIPVYGLNPIFINEELTKTVHNFNERIPIEQLTKGYEVYEAFFEKLMQEKLELIVQKE